MKKQQIKILINAMNNICDVATGEPNGIAEIWDGDIDKLEQHLERIEIYAEDEGLTETGKELFEAARHILESIRKAD